MRLVGLPVPTVWNPPLLTPLLFIAFFLAAAGEEPGYSGYVTDPMQARYTTLTASLIIGLIHAVWHFPSEISIGQTLGLIIWGGVILAVSFRILTVWLYNNTGKSIFVVILLPAIGNTARSIFPGGRPAFELSNASIGYSMVVIASIVVVFLWGSQTLSRYRFSNSKHE